MATTKAKRLYTEVSYEPDCYLMFGPESRGIPEELLVEHEEGLRPDPHVGRDPLSESFQFRRHYPL